MVRGLECLMRKVPKTYSHLGVILAAGAIYSLVVALLPLDVFWIIDGGNKFIQIQSMEVTGLPDVSIHYPARDIDPDLNFFPYCGHHYRPLGDKIYSAFPFYFPLLSFVPYKLLGVAGIYVVPVLSSLFCLLLTCFIVRRIQGETKCTTAVLVLAFFTPFLFYSITFWEHSLAAMLFTLSLLLTLNSRESSHAGRLLLCAGFVLGLSTVFREEGYLLFCSLVAAFLFAFHNRGKVFLFVFGWLIVMVPIWIFQQGLYKHVLGIHALVYNQSLSSWKGTFGLFNLGDVAANWFVYLLKFHENTGYSAWLSIPFVGAFAVGLLCKPSHGTAKIKSFIAGLSCVTSAVLLALLVSHDDPVFNTLHTQALLPSTPFLVFFLLFLKPTLFSKNPDLRFLVATVLLFSVGSGFLLNQKDVGIVWGPRHFVSLYPILVPLSLMAFEKLLDHAEPRFSQSVLRIGAITLLTISLLIQWYGVRTLYLKKMGTEAMVQSVKKLDNEFVVTDVYWFPEEIAAIYYENKILMVDSDEDLSNLLHLFKTQAIRDFTFVTSRHYRRLSNKGIGRIVPLIQHSEHIAPPGMDFMSVYVSDCEM